jgi:hypothetical protein
MATFGKPTSVYMRGAVYPLLAVECDNVLLRYISWRCALDVLYPTCSTTDLTYESCRHTGQMFVLRCPVELEQKVAPVLDNFCPYLGL